MRKTPQRIGATAVTHRLMKGGTRLLEYTICTFDCLEAVPQDTSPTVCIDARPGILTVGEPKSTPSVGSFVGSVLIAATLSTYGTWHMQAVTAHRTPLFIVEHPPRVQAKTNRLRARRLINSTSGQRRPNTIVHTHVPSSLSSFRF